MEKIEHKFRNKLIAQATDNPEVLLNQYVRKYFSKQLWWGLIYDYDAPWFTIVYQDNDVEDMTITEVTKVSSHRNRNTKIILYPN